MTESNVVVIDYGVGNLLSVKRALEHWGEDVVVSSNSDVILSASKVVLPGVGAFANGMGELEKAGLVDTVKQVAEKGTPLLGICLGMQMLFDESEEFGTTIGLGLIPGKVKQIPTSSKESDLIKIPHIGWNALEKNTLIEWSDSILDNSLEGDELYFVHSFMAHPESKDDLLATCNYKEIQITAVVQKNNVMGCQFHPEKSGATGLKIMKRFLEL
jgi:glutamine amidotransferase